MDVRKVLAGSLAALTAGATLVLGGLAASASLGDYVKPDTNALTSPAIAVGDTANVMDVISAADIAAAVAGYATTTGTVTGAVTGASVTDGVGLDTSSTKIYLGDRLDKSGLKTTITKNDLSTLLASGVLTDDVGTTYNYDQYLNMGSLPTATFSTSGGDLSDPKLLLNMSTAQGTAVFNLTVTFNKLLNITSADVQGNKLKLFGSEYTVSSSSTATKLVLFGSSNVQTMGEGDEKTVEVSGKTYTVKLIGVSDASTAAVSVNGESRSVTKGNSYVVSGLSIYIDDLFYLSKTGTVSSAKLSFGADKLIFENGNVVKKGQSEDSIDGTWVAIVNGTGTSGISKMTVAVTAKDSSVDHIAAGGSFTDPVFGVKMAFAGINGGTEDKITVDNSGTTGATVKFTDYRGNEKTLSWAYAPSEGAANYALNASSSDDIIVKEGQNFKRNDYVLVAPSQESDFGHIIRVTSSSSLGQSGAYVDYTDVMSGQTNRIYFTQAGYYGNDFYLDGQQYFINTTNTATPTFQITWGTDSALSNVGSKTTLYPLIKAKGGEWITFIPGNTTNVITVTNTTQYEMPGNSTFNFSAAYQGTTATFGRVTYYFQGNNRTGIVGGSTNITTPSILVLEENAKDTSTPQTDIKNAVIITVGEGTGSGLDVTIQSPSLTDVVKPSATLTSDNSVTEYYDRRGTKVKFDSDGQGIREITYPDDQAIAGVAVGSATVVSFSGATTVEKAVKIQQPVAKLASEVNTGALAGDLILVGGPCVNTLVATLMAADNVTCSSWAYTTGVIKEYTNAFSSGKKALVVAGTTKADTRSLAAKVMQGTLSFSA